MIASKCRVLNPAAVVTVFACIGSQAQTTGCSASRTARTSGGRRSPTRLGAHPDDERESPRNPAGIQPLAQLVQLVSATPWLRP